MKIVNFYMKNNSLLIRKISQRCNFIINEDAIIYIRKFIKKKNLIKYFQSQKKPIIPPLVLKKPTESDQITIQSKNIYDIHYIIEIWNKTDPTCSIKISISKIFSISQKIPDYRSIFVSSLTKI